MSLPDLDEACGRHFTYRRFVECGDTWRRTRIDNAPRNTETYAAMRALAEAVLDPITNRFGEIELTYAFASARLTKEILKIAYPNVTPRGDQHAGCELNARGTPICSRLGQAVDLRVPGRSSREVAAWVALNTPFDRLYFYADDRPFHVSHGPETKGMLLRMRGKKGGNHTPWWRRERDKYIRLSPEALLADPVFA